MRGARNYRNDLLVALAGQLRLINVVRCVSAVDIELNVSNEDLGLNKAICA